MRCSAGLKLINFLRCRDPRGFDCAVPFAIIIMRAFMLSIPVELSEAALVDGAGHWRIFRSIVVPISRTAIITAALFAFLAGWGDFLFALTLTNMPI